VASWSSLDYFGRWKALHYAARRFYAPLLLTIEDDPPRQRVHLSNDALTAWEGSLRWSLETFAGEALDSGSAAASLAAQSSSLLCALDFSARLNDSNRRSLVFIAELWQADRLVARQAAFFAPVKHLSLADPAITAVLQEQDGQLSIDLTCVSLALLVEVSLEGADVVFSDNYFNLPPGRAITITAPLPPGWTLDRARQCLRLFSVYDSYQPAT
jgi:beta-mannosidase